MELTRRQFAKLLAAGAAMLAAGRGHGREPAAPLRFVHALRGKLFPGRVRPLRASDVRTRGKWLG